MRHSNTLYDKHFLNKKTNLKEKILKSKRTNIIIAQKLHDFKTKVRKEETIF